MTDIASMLERWAVELREVRERMYRALTPRERERWHALWLLGRGWSANQVAAFDRDGPAALAFEQTGGSTPPSKPTPKPA